MVLYFPYFPCTTRKNASILPLKIHLLVIYLLITGWSKVTYWIPSTVIHVPFWLKKTHLNYVCWLIKLLVWFWQSLHFSITRLCYNLCAVPRAKYITVSYYPVNSKTPLFSQQVPLGSLHVLFFLKLFWSFYVFTFAWITLHVNETCFHNFSRVPVFLFFLASFLSTSGVLESVTLVFCLGITTQ